MTTETNHEEAVRRAAEHFLTLTPIQRETVLRFQAALDRNLGSLLARTFPGPPTKKGRCALIVTPPAPGEECTIPELREAGLIP